MDFSIKCQVQIKCGLKKFLIQENSEQMSYQLLFDLSCLVAGFNFEEGIGAGYLKLSKTSTAPWLFKLYWSSWIILIILNILIILDIQNIRDFFCPLVHCQLLTVENFFSSNYFYLIKVMANVFFPLLAIFCHVKFRKVMSRLFPLQSIFCNPRPSFRQWIKPIYPKAIDVRLYPNYLCEAIQCGFIPIISVNQYQWSAFYGFELFKFAKVAAWALIYQDGGAVESFLFSRIVKFSEGALRWYIGIATREIVGIQMCVECATKCTMGK